VTPSWIMIGQALAVPAWHVAFTLHAGHHLNSGLAEHCGQLIMATCQHQASCFQMRALYVCVPQFKLLIQSIQHHGICTP
jgi:hypothetical protein